MPSISWLKNHGGLTLTDKEFEDIPNPKLELITHVTIKFVQAFGLLGTCLIGPVAAVSRSSTRNTAGLTRLMSKCGTRGAALGLVVGPLATFARMRSLEEDAITDRCYRLRRNRNQVRVDQASILGGVGGSAVAAMTGSSVPFVGVLGMTAGVLVAAAYNANHGDKTT